MRVEPSRVGLAPLSKGPRGALSSLPSCEDSVGGPLSMDQEAHLHQILNLQVL